MKDYDRVDTLQPASLCFFICPRSCAVGKATIQAFGSCSSTICETKHVIDAAMEQNKVKQTRCAILQLAAEHPL